MIEYDSDRQQYHAIGDSNRCPSFSKGREDVDHYDADNTESKSDFRGHELDRKHTISNFIVLYYSIKSSRILF